MLRLEGTVQTWMPKAQPLSVHEVLQWCKGSAPSEKLDDAALDAARRCVAGLLEAREREGAKTVTVLMERVKRLRELAVEAEPLVPAAIERQRERFLERWQEALAAANATQTISQEALQERADVGEVAGDSGELVEPAALRADHEERVGDDGAQAQPRHASAPTSQGPPIASHTTSPSMPVLNRVTSSA